MPQFRLIFLPVFVFCGIVVSCFAENSTLPDPEKQPEYYAYKWLVITATETGKEKCTCERGVVLNTDSYGNLKDGLFVCVEDANASKEDAQSISRILKKEKIDNYVKKTGNYFASACTAKLDAIVSNEINTVIAKNALSKDILLFFGKKEKANEYAVLTIDKEINKIIYSEKAVFLDHPEVFFDRLPDSTVIVANLIVSKNNPDSTSLMAFSTNGTLVKKIRYPGFALGLFTKKNLNITVIEFREYAGADYGWELIWDGTKFREPEGDENYTRDE